MTLQSRPRCFACRQPVEGEPLFEAACGHPQCPSAVWHGVCLMGWREAYRKGWREVRRFLLHALNEHRTGIPDTPEG